MATTAAYFAASAGSTSGSGLASAKTTGVRGHRRDPLGVEHARARRRR